jgi:hypothetical protein
VRCSQERRFRPARAKRKSFRSGDPERARGEESDNPSGREASFRRRCRGAQLKHHSGELNTEANGETLTTRGEDTKRNLTNASANCCLKSNFPFGGYSAATGVQL